MGRPRPCATGKPVAEMDRAQDGRRPSLVHVQEPMLLLRRAPTLEQPLAEPHSHRRRVDGAGGTVLRG